jgi:hypothetical protein
MRTKKKIYCWEYKKCGRELGKAAMSGDINSGYKDAIEALGCSFFQKPFRLSDLSEWLSKCEVRIDQTQPLSTP